MLPWIATLLVGTSSLPVDRAKLVCMVGDRLAIVPLPAVPLPQAPPAPLEPQPPAVLTALAAAGGALVGSDGQRMWQLRGGRWSALPQEVEAARGEYVLRAVSRGESALFWLGGAEPGTIAGAIAVTSAGVSQRLSRADATQLGSPWEIGFETPILDDRLVDEPSPWGGRLVAYPEGELGDWPSGILRLVRDEGATPLTYRGAGLPARGAVGYGPGGLLLYDGRFVSADGEVLLIAPGGAVQSLSGVRPPCAWLP